MKHLHNIVFACFVAGLFFSTSASADHAAILYCGLDSKNDVRVMAGDTDATSGIAATAARGQSCSQTLHEIMTRGYELFHADVSESERGYIVFVLTKVHE